MLNCDYETLKLPENEIGFNNMTEEKEQSLNNGVVSKSIDKKKTSLLIDSYIKS